jgi:hypothetical protein
LAVEEGKRKRKQAAQGAVCRNVAVALLALARSVLLFFWCLNVFCKQN